MMHTEEQAKKHICPSAGIVDRTCIASRCMAWRWCEAENEETLERCGTVTPIGYCGLAGDPREPSDG